VNEKDLEKVETKIGIMQKKQWIYMGYNYLNNTSRVVSLSICWHRLFGIMHSLQYLMLH
jgi:hypothetical protein